MLLLSKQSMWRRTSVNMMVVVMAFRLMRERLLLKRRRRVTKTKADCLPENTLWL